VASPSAETVPGANLATVMAILARRLRRIRSWCFQVADLPCTAAGTGNTASHYKFRGGLCAHAQLDPWFYRQYLRSGKDVNDFRFAPLILERSSGLPAALIIVAGYDPLARRGCGVREKN